MPRFIKEDFGPNQSTVLLSVDSMDTEVVTLHLLMPHIKRQPLDAGLPNRDGVWCYLCSMHVDLATEMFGKNVIKALFSQRIPYHHRRARFEEIGIKLVSEVEFIASEIEEEIQSNLYWKG